MKRPRIAISAGDPAGIGPELCLQILRDPCVLELCEPLLFADAALLERVASATGLPLPDAGLVSDCGVVEAGGVQPGRVQAACGSAACAYIRAAVKAVQTGHAQAVVTAPINKQSLHLAGSPYPGHTEMLAALTGATRVAMMMACDELVVSLATIHTGLDTVAEQLSTEGIVSVIELTVDALQRLGCDRPRIGVCALNPHGGENGLFGEEETAVILPAIGAARRAGIEVDGPLVPDTAFLAGKRRELDGYVVMYHDQGLIPFKMLAFDKGVNVTLGLPIVRTSPDHGTAFDIAWQGKASPRSLAESVRWAVRMARGR